MTYLFSFLRLAKNKPAAAIMIPQPTIVKIVVPIPPVAGRAESLVSVIAAEPVRDAAFAPSTSPVAQVTLAFVSLIAVSYTHLDVYKRQRQYCSIPNSTACCYLSFNNVYLERFFR